MTNMQRIGKLDWRGRRRADAVEGRAAGASARIAARVLAFLAAGMLLASVSAAGRAAPAAKAGGGSQGAERVYVANSGARSLTVIDHARRSVLATIDLGNNPHGLASAPDGRTLFITTDGGHGEVIAFDTARQEIAWRISVGENLNEPAVTADGRQLYAPELRGGKVYVIDVAARRLAGELPLREPDGVNPMKGVHNAYAGAGGRYLYQTAIGSRALARIDTATRRVERVYSLNGQPRPAALLPDESKAYVQFTHLNGFVELDLRTGAETARVAWPEPAGGRNLATKCHGIAITADGTELWAASNLDEAVYAYSLPELKPITRIDLGGRPHWIAISRDGSTVYVTDRQHGRVSLIDRPARRLTGSLATGTQPTRVHSVLVPGAGRAVPDRAR